MTGRFVRGFAIVGAAGVSALAVAAVASDGDGYTLRAQFDDAGGLREDFRVRIDGVDVGHIEEIELDEHDRAVATLQLDEGAAPVGRDARATVEATNLLGEKHVELDPGDARRPLPAGSAIPPSRTATGVELDDVIDTLDLPTRQALRVFLNEQGENLVGRGRDLGAMLAVLPSSLDRVRELLEQFGHDNRALGRLIEESDRVVTAVAGERRELGRLVESGSGTLAALDSRRPQLGETVRTAPGALRALRRALAELEGAAVPLGPAGRGLRATAAPLTSALQELPGFARSARPTLRVARRTAPMLERLGREGAPVVRRLDPLARRLRGFGSAFGPATKTFERATPDLLGTMEGWARTTQPRDAAGHVFRVGFTTGSDYFASVLGSSGDRARGSRPRSRRRKAGRAPRRPRAPAPTTRPGTGPRPLLPLPQLDLSPPALPTVPRPRPGGNAKAPTDPLLDFLLGP